MGGDGLAPDPVKEVYVVTYEDHIKESTESDKLPFEYQYYSEHNDIGDKLPVAEAHADLGADRPVHEGTGVCTEVAVNEDRDEESHTRNACKTNGDPLKIEPFLYTFLFHLYTPILQSVTDDTINAGA